MLCCLGCWASFLNPPDPSKAPKAHNLPSPQRQPKIWETGQRLGRGEDRCFIHSPASPGSVLAFVGLQEPETAVHPHCPVPASERTTVGASTGSQPGALPTYIYFLDVPVRGQLLLPAFCTLSSSKRVEAGHPCRGTLHKLLLSGSPTSPNQVPLYSLPRSPPFPETLLSSKCLNA